jgi:hypothetical protein
MKTIKLLLTFFIVIGMYSCSEDDAQNQLVQPTFVVTQSLDNPNLYYFENTTPNKEDFFSFWQFTADGKRVIDEAGIVEFEYTAVGEFNNLVTLSMVDVSDAKTATKEVYSFNEEVVIPPPSNSENLLLNGGLELGGGDDFDNWGKWNGPGNMTAETADVYEGARALRVTNSEDLAEWQVQFVSDEVALTVGETYTISFWVKGDAVSVRASTKPDNTAHYGAAYIATEEWTQYATTFDATDPLMRVSLDIGLSSGTFIIDEIALVEGSEPLTNIPQVENLVLNGDLELGSGDDFDNWGKWNGPDNMTEETTEVHGGARALKIVNAEDAAEWQVQFVSDEVEMTVGDSYTISFWVKGDAVNVRASTKPDNTAHYGDFYEATEEWTQYSTTFDATDPLMRVSLDIGQNAGTFYIDDIVLVKN